MKIMVLGGDGFCGWPTALELIHNGHEVLIVDNLARRNIDNELSTQSLTPITDINQRISVANELVGTLGFVYLDISSQFTEFKDCVSEFRPDTIVHFAEQRSAPYSMLDADRRIYTTNNNVNGTTNVLNAIIEVNRDIHLVHLGTMGVYGYNDNFGKIPEGYLDITIKSTGYPTEILYPANPGSVYHMTKCLDQLLFQFYCKNWGLKITDLHQGIVWGTETKITKRHDSLSNRFDYDGEFGTVLNRFLTQAAKGLPLTVYGSGGQRRAFININDTTKCVRLAIENHDFERKKVRIFNQVSEVRGVEELAHIISDLTGCEVSYVDNPRKELAKNELFVENAGLRSLGFEPITLNEGLLDEILQVVTPNLHRMNDANVTSRAKW